LTNILKQIIEQKKQQNKLDKQKILELMNLQNQGAEKKEIICLNSVQSKEMCEFLKQMEKAVSF